MPLDPPPEPSDAARDDSALLDSVYRELRRLAEARIAGAGPRASLVPTELVHEAYLRLQGDDVRWDGPGHYFAAAAEAMRRILVDRARARSALKRGGRRPSTLALEPASEERPEETLALDEALNALEAHDEKLGLVVKLRYFAGLTLDETAAAMDSSPRTVQRDWTLARAWLRVRLDHAEDA